MLLRVAHMKTFKNLALSIYSVPVAVYSVMTANVSATETFVMVFKTAVRTRMKMATWTVQNTEVWSLYF